VNAAPTPLALALLCGASFGAGMVDAIAGGGGLIALPALMGIGLPPHLALGTNKGQAVFGAIASAASFARRGYVDRARVPWGFGLGLLGSCLGALALLAMDPKALRPLVIVLLVAAAAVVAWPRRTPDEAVRRAPLANAASIGAAIALVAGAYDGFFGPGVGTMLLVANTVVYADSLTHASGNAKVVNLASNVAAVVLFAWRGTVVWTIALPMAASNAVGAWVGARLAIRRGDRFVRVIVLVVVAAVVTKLALDWRAAAS
jgi:uncharacterized membrane protein YfcA